MASRGLVVLQPRVPRSRQAGHRTAARRHAGFTLVELVVVIVILGVLSAVALPRFTEFRSQSVAAATQALGGAVRSASAHAHLQCVLQSSICNPTSGTYAISIEGRSFQIWNGYVDAGANMNAGEIDMLVSSTDFTVSVRSGNTTQWSHPSARDPTTCNVQYIEALVAGSTPQISVQVSGC